ncbi:uncharacterized protein LOC131891730 isoform X1 [Tigriopus californicus]|uniref:uncharacterized protein LOC131891730 isoform X1 n=1 Tax=Tigriopus californicus TaxID=6832 RepID=UPI0027DA809F|nr:uncharacterized protein LOC131891730 isoform X1 [Tigriopus californicus]
MARVFNVISDELARVFGQKPKCDSEGQLFDCDNSTRLSGDLIFDTPSESSTPQSEDYTIVYGSTVHKMNQSEAEDLMKAHPGAKITSPQSPIVPRKGANDPEEHPPPPTGSPELGGFTYRPLKVNQSESDDLAASSSNEVASARNFASSGYPYNSYYPSYNSYSSSYNTYPSTYSSRGGYSTGYPGTYVAPPPQYSTQSYSPNQNMYGGYSGRQFGGMYGSFSGHGYGGGHCCKDDNLIELLALGIAIMALMAAMARRRRKRDVSEQDEWRPPNTFVQEFLDNIHFLAGKGLEEFEDKVDKLAHGQGDENSWIGNLYHKFKGSFMGVEGNTIEQDGLEPPILDDKWGLGDVHTLFSENNSTLTVDNSTVASNVTEHSISKRALEDEDAEFLEETAEDDEFVKSLSGDAKCRTKFWRCVGKVAKGSIHYMQEPGGISGAFQKTMFRMAFHGGFGNVWNALMTIPEARRVKRCLNAQEECMSYEALRMELDAGSEFADEHTNKQRLIVNPELVENQDTSDGSEQYSPEVQASLDNNEI